MPGRTLPAAGSIPSVAGCGTRSPLPAGPAAARTGARVLRSLGRRPVAAQVARRKGGGGAEVPAHAGVSTAWRSRRLRLGRTRRAPRSARPRRKGRGTCGPLLVSSEVDGHSGRCENSEAHGRSARRVPAAAAERAEPGPSGCPREVEAETEDGDPVRLRPARQGRQENRAGEQPKVRRPESRLRTAGRRRRGHGMIDSRAGRGNVAARGGGRAGSAPTCPAETENDGQHQQAERGQSPPGKPNAYCAACHAPTVPRPRKRIERVSGERKERCSRGVSRGARCRNRGAVNELRAFGVPRRR